MNRKMVNLISLCIAAAGCLFRILEVDTRSLEYDEIWTLQNYFKCSFSEIFTRLETPNNHPLHTLCAKTVCGIVGEKYWVMRLPALLSGVFLLFGAVYAAKKYFHSKYAKIAVTALIAFSPYLVHYSNTSRGYSMQALFVFLLMCFMFDYARKPLLWKALGIFFAASAALFTVYSGLIFVCAAGGAYLCSFFKWRNWKNELKKNLFLFAAGADFFIVAALWLGLNWEKIRKAQQFGSEITSLMQFFQSAGMLIYGLGLILPLIIVVAAFVLRPKDRVLRFGLSFTLLTMLSMLFTKCGPERVYVPMIAVVFFSAARGIEVIGARFCKIRYIELVLTLAICSPLILMQSDIERISPPDWRYFVTQIEKNTPSDCYVIYPAGDTYPIYVNYKESAFNLAKRSENYLATAIFVSPEKQKISCLAKDKSEKTLELGKTTVVFPLSNNYKMSYYSMEVLNAESFRQGIPLIAFFVFMPKDQYLAVRRLLFRKDECYLLNAFFNHDLTDDSNGQVYRAIPFFIPAPSQNYEYYAKLAELAGSRLKFYILKYE
ncbi:MAG: glycosyltransferase family 39 protein [Lentisphaeria bacterium]|nr:glycosyltransferase family 39 protein [Lentisphaeria bacterium]